MRRGLLEDHKDWTIAVVNYRLSGSKSKDAVLAPAHTHDLALAISFLRKTLHPLQWAIVGHSCGAHMASLVLINPGFEFFPPHEVPPPPQCMVGVQGMYDNRLFCVDFPEWASEIYHSQGTDKSTWLDPVAVEPSNLVALQRVTFHLVHAEEDKYVNLAQPRAFQKVLASWGISSTLQGGPGGHWDGVRGPQVPWLCSVLAPLLQASFDSIAAADEKRRMEAAGYREGIEQGQTHAAQQSFNEGWRLEVPIWLEHGRMHGAIGQACQLNPALEEHLGAAKVRLSEAIASGTPCQDLEALRGLCKAHGISL